MRNFQRRRHDRRLAPASQLRVPRQDDCGYWTPRAYLSQHAKPNTQPIASYGTAKWIVYIPALTKPAPTAQASVLDDADTALRTP